MSTANETLVRTAYAAYERGDVTVVLDSVDPNLEWTYLDPSEARPEPQICHGRGELEIALQRQLGRGLSAQLEELIAHGDQIMVTVRIPGIEAHRVRHADDRNYDVLTVRDGHIVAIRACRDRAEALAIAGIT
jgi:ketosteroid isomerase-like protein